MRDYSKFSGLFWTGRTGKRIRALGRDAQVVAVYLISCRSANMIGLYYLPVPTICHEVGMHSRTAHRVLARLGEVDFAYYDQETEFVWVPNMARFQIGEGLKADDNQHTGIRRQLELLRMSAPARFFNGFRTKYLGAYSLDDLPPSEAPSEAPSNPLQGKPEGVLAHAPADLAPVHEFLAPDRNGGAGGKRRVNLPSRFVPNDFELTEELRAYALRHGLDDAAVSEELENFRLFEFNKPKSDWPRTWMRWARTAVKIREREALASGGRFGGSQAASGIVPMSTRASREQITRHDAEKRVDVAERADPQEVKQIIRGIREKLEGQRT